jgi:peptidoglycan/LPS O-acetylase OafA/YrhL
MMPDDLENFGQSLVATGLSANNVLLMLSAEYFDLPIRFKPLFHTWSLGVEEQYYAVVPLLLMLSMRVDSKRGAIFALTLCSLVSLLLCEYLRQQGDTGNFMLMPSRFWELGMGGLAALLQPSLLDLTGQRRGLRQMLATLGLAMLFGGLFVLSMADNLPGWPALLPVGGTCLVLVYADQTGAGRWLAWRPMVGLGLISYSAYLIHVPIYVLLRIASLDAPTPWELAATVPLALILAWLSWRFVEQRFRDPARSSNRAVLLFSAATLALVIGCGLILHATSGLFAFSDLAKRDQQLGRGLTAAYNDAPFVYEDRPFPVPGRGRNVLVIGNSFARDFINMGLATGHLSNVDLSYASNHNCDALPPRLMEQIRQAQAVIIGSGVYAAEIACVKRTIAQLESLHVPHIAVLGLKDFGFNNNAVMLLPEARRYSYRARPVALALDGNAAARRAIPARYYVDLFAILDDGTGKSTVPVFTPERKLISQDRHHLTRAGARFVGEKLFAQPQFAWLDKPRN